MTVYGGFDPATFQAWSLNLFNSVFVSQGIARGLQVTQTATPSMAVIVNVDSVFHDGVCYLANGSWLRIDAATTLPIGSNTSGATRTDALVAQVDPTNAANLSLSIQANWSQGFNPTSTIQFVIALISVANNATSIVNGNITMSSSTAKVTGAGGSSSGMVASDGVGLAVQDSSASSLLTVVTTGLTTGIGRAITLQTTDISGIGHPYNFDTGGFFSTPEGVTFNPNNIIGGGKTWQIFVNPGDGHIQIQDFTDNIDAVDIDTNGNLYAHGFINATSYQNLFKSVGGGGAGLVVWEGSTDPGGNAGEGDLWAAG